MEKLNNYHNSKIYRIINDVDDKIYIGSTVSELRKRFDDHKRMSINTAGSTKSKLYNIMYEIGIDHFKIVLVEDYKCENKDQLNAREQYWIEFYNTIKNGYNQISAKTDKAKSIVYDYKNGKIYKITNKVNELIYIGSTVQNLNYRFSSHISAWKYNKNTSKLYNAFSEIGIENFNIVLIENFPCVNKRQLEERETYYIQLYDSVEKGYNQGWAKTTEERKQALKKINKKRFNENNKEYIKEYNHENYPKYRNRILEYQKEYRGKNIEKIKIYRSKKTHCNVCNMDYNWAHRIRHEKTKRHQKLLETSENNLFLLLVYNGKSKY